MVGGVDKEDEERIDWLNKICQKASEKYDFTSLREILDFMHA